MSAREIFLHQADALISNVIPSMQGYYLKQMSQLKANTTKNDDTPETVDDGFTQCKRCGIYYGPGTASFKIRSKWKRMGVGKDRKIKRKKRSRGDIEVKCLCCGMVKFKPLAKLPPKVCVGKRKETGIHDLAKKLFIDSPHVKSALGTPSHLIERSRAIVTPGSVNLPIIDKPSKSARKKFRMKPKTIMGPTSGGKKASQEPDLFSFLSSI